MKLLLSSAGWEWNSKISLEFLNLTDKKPSEIKVFLVNTADKKDREWEYVKFIVEQLKKIDIISKNVSIFSLNRKIKKEDLKDIDIIYICGGNTFHYLNGIRKTGLGGEIKRLVKEGVGYFGVSAGSIVVGPSIDIASPFDENDINLKNLTGLKLTNIIISPHFDEKDKKIIKDFEKRNKCKVFRLTDNQALLIKDGKKKLIKGKETCI